MNTILYSTGCPRCHVLETKLKAKNISFELFDNKDKMIEMGLTNVPVLEVDGNRMDFKSAIKWVGEN